MVRIPHSSITVCLVGLHLILALTLELSSASPIMPHSN